MRIENVLASFYKEVYESDFDTNSADALIKMQGAVYLLNESGVVLNDYRFIWFKHGPYSDTLEYDSLGISAEDIASNFKFNLRVKEAIEIVKRDVGKNSTADWVEAVTSVHYISHYMYPSVDINSAVERLAILSPHLDY